MNRASSVLLELHLEKPEFRPGKADVPLSIELRCFGKVDLNCRELLNDDVFLLQQRKAGVVLHTG